MYCRYREALKRKYYSSCVLVVVVDMSSGIVDEHLRNADSANDRASLTLALSVADLLNAAVTFTIFEAEVLPVRSLAFCAMLGDGAAFFCHVAFQTNQSSWNCTQKVFCWYNVAKLLLKLTLLCYAFLEGYRYWWLCVLVASAMSACASAWHSLLLTSSAGLPFTASIEHSDAVEDSASAGVPPERAPTHNVSRQHTFVDVGGTLNDAPDARPETRILSGLPEAIEDSAPGTLRPHHSRSHARPRSRPTAASSARLSATTAQPGMVKGEAVGSGTAVEAASAFVRRCAHPTTVRAHFSRSTNRPALRMLTLLPASILFCEVPVVASGSESTHDQKHAVSSPPENDQGAEEILRAELTGVYDLPAPEPENNNMPTDTATLNAIAPAAFIATSPAGIVSTASNVHVALLGLGILDDGVVDSSSTPVPGGEYEVPISMREPAQDVCARRPSTI